MNENQTRLMVAGQVCLKGTGGSTVEVRRCMAVLSCDGRELGIVAAVCLDPVKEDVAAVLLGRLPPTAVYRMIPVALLDHVSEDAVYLRITAESAEELEQHEAG